MMSLLARQRMRAPTLSPIGCYVHSHSLSLMQLGRTDGTLALRAHATIPLTREGILSFRDMTALRESLRDAVRAGGFRGRDVISAVPASMVRVSPVHYPNTRDADAGVIMDVMRERLNGDIGDYVVDYIPVPSMTTTSKKLAIIATSKREQIDDYLSLLTDAGLNPLRLEIASLGAARMVASGGGQTALVVSIGAEMSSITLVADGRVLSYQRTDFGEKVLRQAVEAALDLDPAAAHEYIETIGLDPQAHRTGSDVDLDKFDRSQLLVRVVEPYVAAMLKAVNRAFQFAESSGRHSGQRTIYVMGRLSRWPGMLELLGARAALPVTQFCDDVASRLRRTPGDNRLPAVPLRSSCVIAAGLAAAAWDQDAPV